jgi:hypothetical protein
MTAAQPGLSLAASRLLFKLPPRSPRWRACAPRGIGAAEPPRRAGSGRGPPPPAAARRGSRLVRWNSIDVRPPPPSCAGRCATFAPEIAKLEDCSAAISAIGAGLIGIRICVAAPLVGGAQALAPPLGAQRGDARTLGERGSMVDVVGARFSARSRAVNQNTWASTIDPYRPNAAPRHRRGSVPTDRHPGLGARSESTARTLVGGCSAPRPAPPSARSRPG